MFFLSFISLYLSTFLLRFSTLTLIFTDYFLAPIFHSTFCFHFSSILFLYFLSFISTFSLYFHINFSLYFLLNFSLFFLFTFSYRFLHPWFSILSFSSFSFYFFSLLLTPLSSSSFFLHSQSVLSPLHFLDPFFILFSHFTFSISLLFLHFLNLFTPLAQKLKLLNQLDSGNYKIEMETKIENEQKIIMHHKRSPYPLRFISSRNCLPLCSTI